MLQTFKIETECLGSFMVKGRGALLDQVSAHAKENNGSSAGKHRLSSDLLDLSHGLLMNKSSLQG